MTIKVRDYTDNHLAVSAADGDKVFEQIDQMLSDETNVSLDFEGIELIISAFLNTAIGKLYSKYDSESIRKHLKISNMSSDDARLLQIVVEHAKKRFSASYPDENVDLLDDESSI